MSGDGFKRRDVLSGLGVGAVGLTSIGSVNAHQPDQYIVGTSDTRGVRAAKSRADDVHRVLDFGDIGQAVAGRFSDRALDALRRRSDVRYVEADGTMEAFAETLPWGIDRVDADKVHADGSTGDGADIAIIDTGIDDDHPDLQANVGSGKAYVDCRGSNCNYPWSDDNDHGTHCAGVSDAVDNSEGVIGVSTSATLHAVKVLDKNGSGSFSDVAAGIEYTADQGWDVGSLSLGASSGSQTVKDACTYAYNNGVLLVAAAGNDGPCTACVGYPAAYSEVIAVSATTQNDALADFSSTGSEVEIAAPGDSIYSTVIDGYDTLSGTSMACPHVAGAGGLLMADGYTNTEARQRLTDTAEDIGLASNESGAGLLDVAAAMGDSSGDTSVAVTTDAPTNVADTSATLNGSLDDLGGASSADCYFKWRQTGADTWNTTAVQTLSATGAFNQDVSGLSAGTDYEYNAVAEASDGDADEGSTVSFSTGSGGGDTAPTVDSYSVTEAGSPNPHCEITADWSVSDADGDLDTVVIEVIDADTGSVADSATHDVIDSTAAGTDNFTVKHADGETFDVTLTVTDVGGNSTSTTQTVTE